MKHVNVWWLLVLGLVVVPHAVLLATGTLWLYERRLLLYWLAGGGALTLAGWGLARLLGARRMAPIAPTVEPAPTWPPTGHAAWGEVEAIAQRVEREDLPLDRPQALWAVLVEVLETVARHYHPVATRPALEIPAPYVLRVVELVAYDLRKAFSEYLPWSHVLTLGDFFRLRRLASWAKEVFFLYRVARLGYNPVAALVREIRQLATGQLQDTSARGIRRWAQGFCVRRAGYYAIQLYGGHLVLDDVAFAAYETRQSKRDAGRARARGTTLEEEPLRILVLGQVKSGKSSLVNALFGEVRAAVDVLPATRYIEPYVLEREGMARAIILDTAGYEKVEGSDDPFDELREQVLDCDLLLMVCSAVSAARGPDRRLVDKIRASFHGRPDRVMPPLVVALTHIDQLRPLSQWSPPYDLAQPADAKAAQILEAARAVREDLVVAGDLAIVPVCLKPGQTYNVEEGLAPVILQVAPEAQRAKYLRCLRRYHEEEYWHRLWRQAVNSGRVLFQAGTAWTRSSSRK
jgi:hypothetical protein